MCGASVVFHVKSIRECLKMHMDSNTMESVTENSIRSFIKHKQIGCASTQAWFKSKGKQCNTAHIQRSWFKEDHLTALDESKYKFIYF